MATIDSTLSTDLKFFQTFGPYIYTRKQLKDRYFDIERRLIQIESLIEEVLIVLSNGLYTRDSRKGRDFSDGSDAKKSTTNLRCISKQFGRWQHSLPFKKIKAKQGLLRAVGYDKFQEQFYFFAFPRIIYYNKQIIEPVLESWSNIYYPPKPTKSEFTSSIYRRCQVKTIEELALISHEEAEARCSLTLTKVN